MTQRKRLRVQAEKKTEKSRKEMNIIKDVKNWSEAFMYITLKLTSNYALKLNMPCFYWVVVAQGSAVLKDHKTRKTNA